MARGKIPKILNYSCSGFCLRLNLRPAGHKLASFTFRPPLPQMNMRPIWFMTVFSSIFSIFFSSLSFIGFGLFLMDLSRKYAAEQILFTLSYNSVFIDWNLGQGQTAGQFQQVQPSLLLPSLFQLNLNVPELICFQIKPDIILESDLSLKPF